MTLPSRATTRATAALTAYDVVHAIARHRFLWATEDDLQRGLTGALEQDGFAVQREVRLNARDRVDLLIGRIGVEVKIAGARRDVERQLARYLKSERIAELILVTSKADHLYIPTGTMPYGGKLLLVHHIGRSGL
jgi:hypothetical protein